MRRRPLLGAGLGGLAGAAGWALASAAPSSPSASAAAGASGAGPKVLRWALPTAEAGFDPPRVSDASSLAILGAIFESPLTMDYLARPLKVIPNTAAAMPEVSADHRHIVVTLKPGIFFADDPVFRGRPRELVAADYVYSLKRFYDPAIATERLYVLENAQLLGLSELRARALKEKKPFDYDTEVPGLRALDRYRFEIRLGKPDPRFILNLVSPQMAGAVAREVVEAYAADPMAHPVGTGPFRLAQWRRSSQIVLERNPRFRGVRYEGEPPADDPQLQAAAAHLRGKTLPLVDRVEVDIIVEDQPRWLAFEGGALDAVAVPTPFAPRVVAGGRLAPYLERQGVQMRRTLMPAVTFTIFNNDNPVVGGTGLPQLALRRAIALACDSAGILAHGFGGQGIVAQSMIPPANSGYDPAFRSAALAHDPARAKALLEMHGYVDRDGDGWREGPDGRPLTLELAMPADQRSRQIGEFWQRRLRAVGLRFQFAFMPFAELIRRTLAGTLQMAQMSWNNAPDGGFYLGLAYGPNAGQSNDARFRLPAYDALFERQNALPDGPEREALMQQAKQMMLAWMPYIPHLHSVQTDVHRPNLKAWVRHPVLELRLLHADLEPGP